ncbi:hypothetical protein [Pedobacter sp. GR22-10]|uniref:hypothetical protein n=1 Tax=Pedobacter sp. GR22-10 TaxID=2994472 RepID=UPI002247C6BB|nr:hypothetical protein [Pedobacter sp. GR22-10]MCX2429609.1 hypothetical protein [Pedobacter sp. GR22-10]
MKKLIFGMLVAVTAVGGSVATYASSLKSGHANLVPQWYRFDGTDQDDPQSYTATASAPTECSGGNVRCAILAEPQSGDAAHPDLANITVFANKAN